MKSIQKKSWSYSYGKDVKKKMPIQCRLCKSNNNDEFCTYNDKEDEFLKSLCEVFVFCPFHLIDYLTEEAESK